MSTYKHIEETTAFLKARGFTEPDVGIVLGTGLGAMVDVLKVEQEIAYEDIPHFPVATVEFHKGKLLIGTIGEKRVIMMQGRFHYYEGYTMQQIVFPIRVLKMLGIKELLISNAAGGLNLDFQKGDLMLIDDHINLLPDNPLRGPNMDELGERFPDMSQPYTKRLNNRLKAIALDLGIVLREGVYVSVLGPNLETRAEYRWLRSLGADAVGMSTVPEVIAANHMNLSVAAISVLTDECDPDNLVKVDIADIIAVAGKTEKILVKLLCSYLQ